ncbi:MAG: hypothetical protein E7399_03200, partial [Ruminococcaceae bacterium]|nr:hypothetical protein [Oscillospiraceae bacterium]
MKNDRALGGREITGLLCMAILPKLFFSLLPDGVGAVGTAVWYTQLLSWGISLLFFFAILHLMKLYPGQTLPEIFQSVLGRGLGIVLGTFFYLYFVAYTADHLGEAVQLIKIYNFPNTPFWLFTAGFLFVAWLICRYGLNGIAKSASLFLIPILIAIFAALLIGSKQYDWHFLFPAGGYGIVRSGMGVLGGVSVYVDLILLFCAVTPEKTDLKRNGFWGMVWCGSAVIFSFLGYLLTFGYRSSQGKTVGLVELVQNVYFNQLFQRMEAIFFLVMVVAVVNGVCIWFYLTVSLYREIYDIQEKKELLLPNLLMVFALATVSR